MISSTGYAFYRVLFSKKTQKFFKSISSKQQQLFFDALDRLIEGMPPLDLKKLQGYKHLYRIRVGDYRIIFEPEEQTKTIYVIIIAHRKDVYGSLSRIKTGEMHA